MRSMMKLLTVVALSLVTSTVFSQVIENTHQHLIFDYVTPKPAEHKVNVYSRINNQVPGQGPHVIEITPHGKPKLNFDIPEKQYELEKKLSASVFRARTGTGTSEGSAFLVDNNLVLTNKHILAGDKATGCKKFGVHLNHVKEFVSCQEVLHCSPVHDFCLIKLSPMKNGHEVGQEVEPLKMSLEKPAQDEHSLIIGNALGAGIHAASYKGIYDLGSDWGHFNRAFSGNSGSPLFNEKGEIIGIHHGRGGVGGIVPPADRMVGFAVKTETMIDELKELTPEYYAQLLEKRRIEQELREAKLRAQNKPAVVEVKKKKNLIEKFRSLIDLANKKINCE